jgi:hypothetical protein
MSRKRAPLLNVSVYAEDSSVSSKSDRHLTRARLHYHVLTLLLTDVPSLPHDCRPSPTPDAIS